MNTHQPEQLQSNGAPAAQAPVPMTRRTPRIVILGGGYVGLYTALRLRKRFHKNEVSITVVDPRSYMTYQPFLPEAAAGSLEASHVVVSHRRELKDIDVLSGRVSRISHAERRVQITPEVGDAYWVNYDHVVVALGAVSRTLPIPGLKENAMGFKQVEEAMALHNHVLNKLDVAASTWDKDLRKRMLTFTFVGGGFAGIEALAEIEDMVRAAIKFHDGISQEDVRFVMVEGSTRILPEVGDELGGYALEQLRKRGIEFKLATFLESCVDGKVVLSDGSEYESDTIVWTAGVKASPVLQNSDFSLDSMGRVRGNAYMQLIDDNDQPIADAWAAGDCAAIPDLTRPGEFCGPTAQHAVRQARRLGDNIARNIRGAEMKEYSHKNAGTVAGMGLGKGVAIIKGIKFRGPLAWFMHRTYHMWAMPTLNRKVRIILDWTLAIFFRRELVALGRMHEPRADFELASQMLEMQTPQDASKIVQKIPG